jgi:hypothetical protein
MWLTRGPLHVAAIVAILAASASLAVTSLLTDSITFDETGHLAAGASYLHTSDFRLSPEHPPLVRIWAALPMLLLENAWPPRDSVDWMRGDYWGVGRQWLFQLNDGERLLPAARAMIVVLMLGAALAVYALARRIFGAGAGLLALALAAFCPTLLAHGRLVTTDVGSVLAFCLALLTFEFLVRRPHWVTALLAGLALAALILTKMSWPLVLPALAAMLITEPVIRRMANARPRPFGRSARVSASSDPSRATLNAPRQAGRRHACAAGSQRAYAARLGVSLGIVAVVVWSSIWTCYGWRFSAFRDDQRHEAMMMPALVRGQAPPRTMEETWAVVLLDAQGQPRASLTARFVSLARRLRLLPEAYLYGLAYTDKTAGPRPAYLLGKVADQGWYEYFPIACLVKTPVPTLLLALAGLAACATRRVATRAPALAAGLLVFALTYALAAVMSRFNVGVRHILPLYPLIWVLGGAPAAWCVSRLGRGAVAALLAWLGAAMLWTHPHYLSYFNELAGGPRHGHAWLADSNIDWGQDLKRLAAFARDHPDERILLSYFGSADPRRYGFRVELLPSFLGLTQPIDLTPGTYVISMMQLLGVYDTPAREGWWDDQRARLYQQLHRKHHGRTPADFDPGGAELERERNTYNLMRWGRLMIALRSRQPDERVGRSLWVFRLTREQLDALTAPPP